jgi:hypothetical protein
MPLLRMQVSGDFRADRRAWPLAALIVSLLALVSTDTLAAAAKKKRHSTRSSSTSGEVYRWVDDKGVVHFGDQVPAEYAPIDREVLNKFGTPLRTEQGALTEEEIAAEKKAVAEKKAALVAARRDEVLLSTYLSVEEIEALRDRRMELINGQFSVTTTYLQTLKDKLKQLQLEASKFKPYSKDPEAAPIDEKLAQELSDIVDSISLYEKTLADTRNRQSRVAMAFDADIARFKELRGL